MLYPGVISDEEQTEIWMNRTEQCDLFNLAATIRTPHWDIPRWTDLKKDDWNDLLPMNRPKTIRECRFVFNFLMEFLSRFGARKRALAHSHYRLGTKLGKKWATEFAAKDEIEKLRNIDTFLFDELYRASDRSAPPSHELLWGIYEEDDRLTTFDGQCYLPPDLYYEFWNQLFSEHLSKDNYLQIVTPVHPLQSIEFALGFIDGATGQFNMALKEINSLV